MSDKYYTPSIEEFHVGFEYEIEDIHDSLVDTTWRKQTYGFSDTAIGIQEIGLKSMRVKYLDREDIESCHKEHFKELKFVYDNNAEPIPGRTPYECPTAYLLDDQLYTGQLWILYHFESDGMVWIEYVKDCGGQGYLFKGTIKNKSELKRILKQIGV